MASSLTPYRPHTSPALKALPPMSSKKKQAKSGNSFWEKAAQMLFSCSSSTPPLTSTRQSQASSSQRSIPAKRVPSPSSQVFGCTEFRYHIFTYLQFPEVGVAKRVSHIWNDSVPQQDPAQNALKHHHRSRTSLYISHEYLILAKAFKIPLVKKLQTAEVWMRIFEIAGNHFSQLKSLDLSWIPKEIQLLFNSSAVQMPQVEWVNFGCTSLPPEELFGFLDKMPLLRTIILQGFEIAEIPKSIITTKGCNWTSLNFPGCRKVNTETLHAIGKGCPQLRELDISRTSRIQKNGMEALSMGCSDLASLVMQGNAFDSAAFPAMVFRNLALLDMGLCTELDQPGLEAIRQGCSSLTYLNLAQCNGLRDEAFFSLIFSALQTLKFTRNPGLTKRAMESISRGNPNLIALELVDCSLDTNTFEAIVFNRLKTLELAYCQPLNARNIEILSRGCPELTALFINSYDPKFHLILEAIAKFLTRLQVLWIQHPSINKRAVQVLGRRKTLVDLTLHGSQKISSESLKTIPVACPQLISLDISYNKEVNLNNLRVIAGGCRQLTNINVSSCYNVTWESLRVIALTGPLIKTIKLKECEIENSEILSLRDEFPHITFIDK